MTLTPHQQQALAKIQAFVKHPQQRIFVLRGYAGTGKTTLVGQVVDWLQSTNFRPVLLASTGRAAKVLQNKTGHTASTIHSCIYTFDSISGKDDTGSDPWMSQTGQLFLDFGLKPRLVQTDNLIYIVDEASMLTHEPPQDVQMARFGSGSLLDDFVQFAGRNKIIFVGDPCQLPPVAQDAFSSALDEQFLARRYGIATGATELQEILRQQADSGILQSAGRFREHYLKGSFEKYPKVAVSGYSNIHTFSNEQELISAYRAIANSYGFWELIMICHSNKLCAQLNQNIRQELGRGPLLEADDVLMVVQNSYDVALANGDQVLVKEMSFDCRRAGLDFYNVEVTALHNFQTYRTKLIANMLYNEAPGISSEQMKPLFIDFDQRMKQYGIPRNSEGYRQAMLRDPYLNALRAKFGYAVTCHKAQGGEWPYVFLYLHKSLYGMQRPNLYRWYYTAMTRARETLCVNRGWWTL